MKKTYIAPEMLISLVATQHIMVTSEHTFQSSLNEVGEDGSAALVKGSAPSYNVWNDDWSE